MISDAGTGKCTLTQTSPTVVDGAACAVALLQVLLMAEQNVVEWVLDRAKAQDETVNFDELMGNK